MRGIRGAIDISKDGPEAVLAATRELLTEILKVYPELRSEDKTNVIFIATEDLKSAYPAWAAREKGWYAVQLLYRQEHPIPVGLPHNIRT